MFFFAMEEMLVPCRPFDGCPALAAAVPGLSVWRLVLCVCAPLLLPLLQTFYQVIVVFDN